MVNTWQDQWFNEEGTRVLYLLPRSWTDQILPLAIEPKPDEIVRVMVGRAELITPTMELALKEQVTRYHTGQPRAKVQAVKAVRELGIGRFLEPATRRMLARSQDKEFAQAAWKLAAEASKTAEDKEPAVAEERAPEPSPKTAAIGNPTPTFGRTAGF
jgi:hypothetical protein